jgi:hypothetical protein
MAIPYAFINSLIHSILLIRRKYENSRSCYESKENYRERCGEFLLTVLPVCITAYTVAKEEKLPLSNLTLH